MPIRIQRFEAFMLTDRDLLVLRYVEIDCELEALAEGRVVDGNPVDVEATLLDEREEIECRLGADYFERRDAA
jgi:hypothetical protein